MAFTPGPWAYESTACAKKDPDAQLPDGCDFWIVGGDTGEVLALTDGPMASGDQESNARLISAAPELLACLRRMCGMYGAYSRRLAPLLAEDEGTVWTFERANSLALEAIAKAEGR